MRATILPAMSLTLTGALAAGATNTAPVPQVVQAEEKRARWLAAEAARLDALPAADGCAALERLLADQQIDVAAEVVLRMKNLAAVRQLLPKRDRSGRGDPIVALMDEILARDAARRPGDGPRSWPRDEPLIRGPYPANQPRSR